MAKLDCCNVTIFLFSMFLASANCTPQIMDISNRVCQREPPCLGNPSYSWAYPTSLRLWPRLVRNQRGLLRPWVPGNNRLTVWLWDCWRRGLDGIVNNVVISSTNANYWGALNRTPLHQEDYVFPQDRLQTRMSKTALQHFRSPAFSSNFECKKDIS